MLVESVRLRHSKMCSIEVVYTLRISMAKRVQLKSRYHSFRIIDFQRSSDAISIVSTKNNTSVQNSVDFSFFVFIYLAAVSSNGVPVACCK